MSSTDQNETRQVEALSAAESLFTDRVSSKNTERATLDDLRRLVTDLRAKDVRGEFIQEWVTFTGDDNAMARLLLSGTGFR